MKSHGDTTTFSEWSYLAEMENRLQEIGNGNVTVSPIARLRDPCFAERPYTHTPSILYSTKLYLAHIGNESYLLNITNYTCKSVFSFVHV